MSAMHDFEINELKCSETGENHKPLLYIDGVDGSAGIQLWFNTRSGVSHERLHGLIKHMHELLESCHLEITATSYPQRRTAAR